MPISLWQILRTYPDQPFLWLRFIDDIFMIWTHGTLSLDNFIVHLNKCLPSINFTHEISPDQVPFLDTMANTREGKLITNLYCKPTDAHNYLHYSSAHPTSCKKAYHMGSFSDYAVYAHALPNLTTTQLTWPDTSLDAVTLKN